MPSAALAHELILGRYRPLRPLGSGGMGHVWLAQDERSGLDIALKIVAREGKAGSRAEREARAAASLRHERCQRIISLARDPSPAYIPPERLLGRTATAAADGWAVGVLLWEALAGQHPFWGGDLVETSKRIQAGAPALETLRPDLPQHVLRVVASALVLNPQRRPS